MKAIARIISYVFHPFLFPLYGALLVLALDPNLFGPFGDFTQMKWIIIVIALTIVFPAIWILMMRGLEMINSFRMDDPKERIVPFVATMTFYLWAAWMFKANVHMKMESNPFIFYMLLGACLSVFSVFFLNNWARISLHTLGAGSIIGLLLILIKFSTFDLRMLFEATILLAGIIGTARLILKANTGTEVMAGYFIGFTGQFLAFSVISRIV